ncbi:MAG: hypothetical protein HY917_01890 [Candidatus Diapherotrites archaeon]|nr:hypothetical protein [Candidatus Diapherotrites archaeon]
MPSKTTIKILLVSTILFLFNAFTLAALTFALAFVYALMDLTGSTKSFAQIGAEIKKEVAAEKKKIKKAHTWYPGARVKAFFRNVASLFDFRKKEGGGSAHAASPPADHGGGHGEHGHH